MAKKLVTTINEDAILQISVSGAYYKRVVDLMTRLIEKQPDIKQSLLNINGEGVKLNMSEAVIQTYMMLIKSVEDAANENLTAHTSQTEIEMYEEDPATEDSKEDPSES